MLSIRVIDEAHKADINIPNEPFPIFGKMIPSCRDGVWSYRVETFQETSWMRFPDENYDYDAMTRETVFLGAYDGERCVGLAVLQKGFFHYMYLLDLKVNADARKQGVGAGLMEAAKKIAREKGYGGVYCQAQDDNLAACLFYLKCGFYIGGFDNALYKGSRQEGKADILFYLDC